MNLDLYKQQTKRYKTGSHFIFIVSSLVLLAPSFFLLAFYMDNFILWLSKLIPVKQNLGIDHLLVFLLFLPGLLLICVVHIFLIKSWRKKPETTCVHCNAFLISRSEWITKIGRCFQCGKILFDVHPDEWPVSETENIAEDQKLEIIEIKQFSFRQRMVVILSMITGLSLMFSLMSYLNTIFPSDSGLIPSLLMLFSILLFMTPMFLGPYFLEKKYPFPCPSCNKSLHGKNHSLIQLRCCPHCEVEIVKDPNKEDTTEHKLINPAEFIRVSHLYSKYVFINCFTGIGGYSLFLIPCVMWLESKYEDLDFLLVLPLLLLMPFSVLLSNKFYNYIFFRKYHLDCVHCRKLLLGSPAWGVIKSKNYYYCGRQTIEEA